MAWILAQFRSEPRQVFPIGNQLSERGPHSGVPDAFYHATGFLGLIQISPGAVFRGSALDFQTHTHTLASVAVDPQIKTPRKVLSFLFEHYGFGAITHHRASAGISRNDRFLAAFITARKSCWTAAKKGHT